MQRSDEAMFDELFSYACPKFITPSPPNCDEPLVNFNQVRRRYEACGCMGSGRQVWKIDSVDSMLLGQCGTVVPQALRMRWLLVMCVDSLVECGCGWPFTD